MLVFSNRRAGVLSGAAGALGLMVLALAPAQAQTMPEWQAPAGFDDGRASEGKAKRSARSQGKPQAAPVGGLGAPMRSIDRSEIDMTGVGREVRNMGSGVRPMMNGGSMGVGGGF